MKWGSKWRAMLKEKKRKEKKVEKQKKRKRNERRRSPPWMTLALVDTKKAQPTASTGASLEVKVRREEKRDIVEQTNTNTNKT